jgi:hypothetical protein
MALVSHNFEKWDKVVRTDGKKCNFVFDQLKQEIPTVSSESIVNNGKNSD